MVERTIASENLPASAKNMLEVWQDTELRVGRASKSRLRANRGTPRTPPIRGVVSSRRTQGGLRPPWPLIWHDRTRRVPAMLLILADRNMARRCVSIWSLAPLAASWDWASAVSLTVANATEARETFAKIRRVTSKCTGQTNHLIAMTIRDRRAARFLLGRRQLLGGRHADNCYSHLP